MKTLSNIRTAALSAIAAFALFFASPTSAHENFYEKIVPNFAERSDVDMRYLGAEAYESLAGIQLISMQTRSLAEECIGDITSVVILNSNSENATKIGLSEFDTFRKRNSQMRLLMRTRSGHAERSSWFLPQKGTEPPMLIVIVRDAQTLMIAIMTGDEDTSDNDDDDDDFPFGNNKTKNKKTSSLTGNFYYNPDGSVTISR